MFQFKTLKQLLTYFSDEKTCRDYLEQKRWKGKPVCPHCGSTTVYRLANDKQFKCGNKKGCDKKFTVTVGTIFENSKIPLSTWFAAIYMATSHKKGISSLQLHRELGVTPKTAWFLLHRIRHMVDAPITLSETVQVDETYVSGKAKNRHKKQRKGGDARATARKEVLLWGMVDKDKAVLKVVESADRYTVWRLIHKVIEDKQAVIVTDGNAIYHGLEADFKGRILVNHSLDEWKVGPYHTNTIEGAFGLFKRTIFGTYHNVSLKHLQRYCTLFSYRYNTRKLNEYQRFDDTLSNVTSRLTYPALIQKVK